jgi:hypothetical protein
MMMMRSTFALATLVTLTSGVAAKLTIVLVAVLRDETPTVHEWVKHHVAVGIRDFVLVPNECSFSTYNQFLRALPRFSPSDGVNVMLMPRYRCVETGFQGAAYRAAADFVHDSRPDLAAASTRLAFWDLDEFAVVRSDRGQQRNFVELLEEFAPETSPSWSLLSLAYGSSGREKRPGWGSVQANFVERAPLCNDLGPDDTNVHLQPKQSIDSGGSGSVVFECRKPSTNGANIAAPYLVKSICRLDAMLESKKVTANPAHHCLDVENFFPPEDLLRLNHYTSKSQEEFEIKAKRGFADKHHLEHRHGLVPKYYSQVVDLSILASFVMMDGCAAGGNESAPCSEHWIFDHDKYPESTRARVREHCNTFFDTHANSTHPFQKAYYQACTYLMRAKSTAPTVVAKNATVVSKKSLKLIGAGLGTTVSCAP